MANNGMTGGHTSSQGDFPTPNTVGTLSISTNLVERGYMADKNRGKPYGKSEWQRVREQVLKLDKYECQRCKGIYDADESRPRKLRKATLVHHHFILEKYPEWKYSIFVEVDGETKRNLVSLCHDCHEEIHKETHRSRSYKAEDEFTTPERWD